MAVTPDGQRFLVRVPGSTTTGAVPQIPFLFTGAGAIPQSTQQEIRAGLTVIRNWPALSSTPTPTSGRRP
jgi:hypothetical protein